jgi:hypothetical protein
VRYGRKVRGGVRPRTGASAGPRVFFPRLLCRSPGKRATAEFYRGAVRCGRRRASWGTVREGGGVAKEEKERWELRVRGKIRAIQRLRGQRSGYNACQGGGRSGSVGREREQQGKEESEIR